MLSRASRSNQPRHFGRRAGAGERREPGGETAKFAEAPQQQIRSSVDTFFLTLEGWGETEGPAALSGIGPQSLREIYDRWDLEIRLAQQGWRRRPSFLELRVLIRVVRLR